MPFENLLMIILISPGLSFALDFFQSARSTHENRIQTEPEKWKLAAFEIGEDSVNWSRSTLKGRIAEQMAPGTLRVLI